ncbi:hypothetical protein MRX96_046600 [Rhipicephalus microplus]
MPLYRLCVFFIYNNIESLLLAHEDTFASAFPLNVSKELAEQSLKQHNFTSWCDLLQYRLSHKWLRYFKCRLTTATLSQLPRFVGEALSCFRQLVELSRVAVVNRNDRSVVGYSTRRSIYATPTQRHSPRSADLSDFAKFLADKLPGSIKEVTEYAMYHRVGIRDSVVYRLLIHPEGLTFEYEECIERSTDYPSSGKVHPVHNRVPGRGTPFPFNRRVSGGRIRTTYLPWPRQAPCSLGHDHGERQRSKVELSLDGVVNANERSVVELLGQQDYLRQGHVSPTQCRRPCMLRGESPRKVTSTTRRSPFNRPRLADSAR